MIPPPDYAHPNTHGGLVVPRGPLWPTQRKMRIGCTREAGEVLRQQHTATQHPGPSVAAIKCGELNSVQWQLMAEGESAVATTPRANVKRPFCTPHDEMGRMTSRGTSSRNPPGCRVAQGGGRTGRAHNRSLCLWRVVMVMVERAAAVKARAATTISSSSRAIILFRS